MSERLPIPQIPLFDARATKGLPHWPTLRGARLDDAAFKRLRILTDLIYLEGHYTTNLNKYSGKPDRERALFGESRKTLRTSLGGSYILYILWWIGNYHAGSIVHIGFQYPHILAFRDAEVLNAACAHYRRVAAAAYGTKAMDGDVSKFINDHCRGNAKWFGGA